MVDDLVDELDKGFAARVLDAGAATPEQVADAKRLAAKMRELGLEKDVLDALLDRGVIRTSEAESFRRSARGEGPDVPEPAEGPPGAPHGQPTTGPAAGARPASPRQPLCANHPYAPGTYMCFLCGKTVCAECVVRTPSGFYCSWLCVDRATLGNARANGRPPAVPMKAVVIGASLTALAALLAFLVLRPSKRLVLARGLRADVERYEGRGRHARALVSARRLAAIDATSGEAELDDLVGWGRSRAKALRAKVVRPIPAAAAKGLPSIETLFPPDTVAAPLAAPLAQAEPGIPSARQREAEAFAAAKAALVEATEKAASLMRTSRFGEAIAAVERHRRRIPGPLRVEFGPLLDGLKRDALAAARAAYEQREASAEAHVRGGEYGKAEAIYRDIVDTFGVKEIVERAREPLAEVSALASAHRDGRPRATRTGYRRFSFWELHADDTVRVVDVTTQAGARGKLIRIETPMLRAAGDLLSFAVMGGRIVEQASVVKGHGRRGLWRIQHTIRITTGRYGYDVRVARSPYLHVLGRERVVSIGVDRKPYDQEIIAVAVPVDARLVSIYDYQPYRHVRMKGWDVFYYDASSITRHVSIHIKYVPGLDAARLDRGAVEAAR